MPFLPDHRGRMSSQYSRGYATSDYSVDLENCQNFMYMIWPSPTAGRCSTSPPARPAGPPICWKRTSGSCGHSRPCSRARSGHRSSSREVRRCPRPTGRFDASPRMSTSPTTFERSCPSWSVIIRMPCHRTAARSGSGRRQCATLWARGHMMSPGQPLRGVAGRRARRRRRDQRR